MRPSVLKQRQGIQLSYDLPHKVHSSNVYPRRARNGSSVIVYGHDTGLRVVWYAGRKIKSDWETSSEVNGGKDEPMVIDLNDEPKQSRTVDVEFEDEVDEIDPSEPYHGVIQHLDISLGSAVSQLAVPNLQVKSEEDLPELLHDHLLVAVACTDLTIRVIAVSIDPPASESSDVSHYDWQMIRLHGSGAHQDLITALAITLSENEEEAIESKDETQTNASARWSVLIASTSCTGSGLLLLHQIPITNEKLTENTNDLVPLRRVHLRAPLMSARLSFNIAPTYADRHCLLLVTIPDASCVKIYDPFPQTLLSRSRRGSVATTDSASSTRSTPTSGAGSGKVVITLLPDFRPTQQVPVDPLRKRIMDSAWVLGGRAVIALLEGGEWGVWDLEGAGPTLGRNQNLIQGQGNVAGVVGGGVSKFALNGRLSNPVAATKKSESQNTSTGLVPATPHTRKTRADGLFQGTPNTKFDSTSTTQDGALVVTPSSKTKIDESVLISYGSQSIYISSLMAYWKAGASSLVAAHNSHAISLPSIRIAGQKIKSIDLLLGFEDERTSTMFSDRTPPNVVLATNTRLIFFVQPLSNTGDSFEALPQRQASLQATHLDKVGPASRDVEAIDRILDTMDSPTPQTQSRGPLSTARPKPNFGKSVMLGDDVEMGDVSPAPTPRSKLTIQSSQGSSRRLFS